MQKLGHVKCYRSGQRRSIKKGILKNFSNLEILPISKS